MPENESIIKAEGVELNEFKIENVDIEEAIKLRQINDFTTFEIKYTVPYIYAEDANFYPVIYESDVKCFLLEAREWHTGASTSGTLRVEKLPNGTAPGSGSGMLDGNFSTSTLANRVQRQGPSSVLAAINLNPGDAVSLRAGGNTTGARNVSVTLIFGINLKDVPTGQSATTIISGI